MHQTTKGFFPIWDYYPPSNHFSVGECHMLRWDLVEGKLLCCLPEAVLIAAHEDVPHKPLQLLGYGLHRYIASTRHQHKGRPDLGRKKIDQKHQGKKTKYEGVMCSNDGCKKKKEEKS